MSWKIDLPKAEFYTLQSPELDGLVREVADEAEVAIDTETTGLIIWKEIPLFWSLSWGNRRICMPADTLPAFHRAFADPYKRWIFANAKFDCHMLANVGIEVQGRLIDTQVMHALLYEELPHSLEYMGKVLLNLTWKGLLDDWNSRKCPSVGDHILHVFATNPSRLIEYASNDAYATMQIYKLLRAELEATRTFTAYPQIFGTLWKLFNWTEVPFTKVLWECERNGLKVDRSYLETKRKPVQERMDRIERAIVHEAGYPLNPNSGPQMKEYFFGKLKLTPIKFTKGGKSGRGSPSVDQFFLERYADTVPVAKLALEYSGLKTILRTYIKGVIDRLDPKGYLHTHFNQGSVRTGRLSCIAGWTRLKTTRGNLTVAEVQVGDCVWTHKNRWRPVLDVFTKGFEDMYDLHLNNGEVLTCTAAHKLLRADGQWIKVEKVLDEGQCQSRALFAGEGLPDIEIEVVHYRGRYEVYDLTVEEDASYSACGVFSHNSSDPNMQNWPKVEGDEFGLRGAIICEPDENMIVGDYEAVEMRLLAAASGEQGMINVFLNNWDIHMGNASIMYEIPYDDIVAAKKVDKKVKSEFDAIASSDLSPEERDAAWARAHEKMTPYVHQCLTARSDAKTIGFGLNYGMKAGKLAGRLGCDKATAQAKIDKYMGIYPAVTRFYDATIEEAYRTGYAYTFLGRRRFLPEIVSDNAMDRWQAERQAVNTVIQGTAAEVAKMAMVCIHESGILKQYGAKMRSQIHDELIHTCHRDQVGDLENNKRAMAAIQEIMESPFPTDLAVPLSVSIGHGVNWMNAK